jgi:predicted GNAT family acetyltransferase
MQVKVVEDASEFAARARPWLDGHPVEANVAATVLEATVAGQYRAEEGLWLLVLDGHGDVIGAGLQTPPYPLLLPPLPDGAAVAVAAELAGRARDLPGVNGPSETSTAFALAWRRLTGATVHRSMAERVYVLEALTPPAGVSGCARAAAGPDLELCVRWWDDFHAEAWPGTPRSDPTPQVSARIGAGLLWLWEDGEPVSMAGVNPPAAGVARVGPVYTPPALRRRGYASAVTAAATRAGLAAGANRCMLYTDLANPTSNAIYQRLGYRAFADAVAYRFEPAAPPG